MDDATTARLAALRIEYAEARRELENALADGRSRNVRLHELAGRVQSLYADIYCLEHGLTD